MTVTTLEHNEKDEGFAPIIHATRSNSQSTDELDKMSTLWIDDQDNLRASNSTPVTHDNTIEDDDSREYIESHASSQNSHIHQDDHDENGDDDDDDNDDDDLAHGSTEAMFIQTPSHLQKIDPPTTPKASSPSTAAEATAAIANLPKTIIDESLLSKELKVKTVGNNKQTKVVYFTGKVGNAARSVRTTRPLTKPKGSRAPQPQKSFLPLSGEKKKWPRLLQRRKNAKSKTTTQTTNTTTTEATTTDGKMVWKPFQEPFCSPNGTLCRLPRLVTYYEVHIVDKYAALYDHSPSAVWEEEKVPEDEDWNYLAVKQTTPDTNISRVASNCNNGTTTTTTTSTTCTNHQDCIAVGMAQQDFALHKSMPGWDEGSHAYHGDDGSAFYNRSKRTSYGPTFGVGDVVGCGIDYRTQAMFYTLNGHFLGYTFQLSDQVLSDAVWYPTIGIDSSVAAVQCNMGTDRPFLFDLQTMCEYK